MLLATIANNAPLFLALFARVFVLLRVAPLTSSAAIPGVARVALTFFVTIFVFPGMADAGYPMPDTVLGVALIVVGEALIGLLTALFLVVMFAVFQLAGQFFSLQMGFGASQVFDPMAQIQIPLMGQFLNMVALLVFIVTGGFQKIFLYGVQASMTSMRAVDIAGAREDIFILVTGSLSHLFENSLILAFPILATLFMLSVTMGLFGKAAPQMNLLMLGFPIAILLAFLILFLVLPYMVEAFDAVMSAAFKTIGTMFRSGRI
jgi:flagellar biosynthetic protein FliR